MNATKIGKGESKQEHKKSREVGLVSPRPKGKKQNQNQSRDQQPKSQWRLPFLGRPSLLDLAVSPSLADTGIPGSKPYHSSALDLLALVLVSPPTLLGLIIASFV